MTKTKIAIVYCGHYRQALLHPLEHESASNECCFESRVKVSTEDWNAESCEMTCPTCKNILYHGDGHFIEDDGRKYFNDSIIDLTQ